MLLVHAGVTCKQCNKGFNVIRIDGKLLGQYICPYCGEPFHE